jgi:hypothetical protein
MDSPRYVQAILLQFSRMLLKEAILTGGIEVQSVTSDHIMTVNLCNHRCAAMAVLQTSAPSAQHKLVAIGAPLEPLRWQVAELFISPGTFPMCLRATAPLGSGQHLRQYP